MTKKDRMKKVWKWFGIAPGVLTFLIISVPLFITLGYKAHGQKLVKDTIKEELKPIIIRMALVEKSIENTETNNEKLIDRIAFLQDWMRKVDEKAYNAVEKDREIKRKWLEN